MNFVGRLRKTLRMTQNQLAHATGLGLSTIAQAEGGKRVSDATLARLKNFAVERGLAHLVAEHFPVQVTRVFEPAPPGSGLDLHTQLDEILQSREPDLTMAVEKILMVCTQYLRKPK